MKQHTTPLLLQGDKSFKLNKISFQESEYDEDWIQRICYENPNILPIEEIEPAFGGLVPICREMNTESGACDIVYLNEEGNITIVECKLWKNPEARRKVVAQILDYAKDIAGWDYQEFQSKCLKARENKENSLFEIMENKFPDIDEKEFIDRIQKNLQRGRFLLLIIGDGIRENMEDLAAYVQGNGGQSFTLSLIEMPVFRHPYNEELIITPRVLVKTKEIERTFIRIKETAQLEEVSVDKTSETISEKEFYEQLAKNRGQEIASRLKKFVNELEQEFDLLHKLGKTNRTLNIKSPDDSYNFATIQENGNVKFYGVVSKAEEMGDRQIGIDYLTKLAEIVNGKLDKKSGLWRWSVKKNNQYIMVDEYLEVADNWKKLISNTLEEIQKIEQE